MSKFEDNLKPGVTKTDFYVTLTTGLVTTGVSVLGLLSGEWAAMIITGITSLWAFIRLRIGGKQSGGPGPGTAALAFLALMSLSLVSCNNMTDSQSVSYTTGDYTVTISKKTPVTGDVVIHPDIKK